VSFGNGLWLCPKCHRLVDDSRSVVDFPAIKLLQWKAKAKTNAIKQAKGGIQDIEWERFASIGTGVSRRPATAKLLTLNVEHGDFPHGQKPLVGIAVDEGEGEMATNIGSKKKKAKTGSKNKKATK